MLPVFTEIRNSKNENPKVGTNPDFGFRAPDFALSPIDAPGRLSIFSSVAKTTPDTSNGDAVFHLPPSFSIVSSGCQSERKVGILARSRPGRFGNSPAPCSGMFAEMTYTEFAGSLLRR